MKHPELRCSACGYVPDDEDMEKTGYHLGRCQKCGRENICDLCLGMPANSSLMLCPDCAGTKPWGAHRKWLLKEELALKGEG